MRPEAGGRRLPWGAHRGSDLGGVLLRVSEVHAPDMSQTRQIELLLLEVARVSALCPGGDRERWPLGAPHCALQTACGPQEGQN